MEENPELLYFVDFLMHPLKSKGWVEFTFQSQQKSIPLSVTWHKLDLPIFPSNNLLDHEVSGKTVCLVKKEDKIYAVAHKCPHSGAIMSEGWMDARGYLVCPLHKYLFDVKNGRNVSGEGYVLKHWPIEEREDGVYIGLEDQAGQGF